MPLFDYKCISCDHKREVLVLKGHKVIDCDQCGSRMIKKASAPAGIKFSGKDFYKPGYSHRGS